MSECTADRTDSRTAMDPASAPTAPLDGAPAHPLFEPADYAMFGLMMGVSALVGVYYGCYKKQDTVQDYLLGGKAMSIFPVAMSLIARYDGDACNWIEMVRLGDIRTPGFAQQRVRHHDAGGARRDVHLWLPVLRPQPLRRTGLHCRGAVVRPRLLHSAVHFILRGDTG